MARDFTIKNSDVRAKEITAQQNLNFSPIIEGYTVLNSDLMPVINYSTETKEIVYGPISLQIKGPISLRQRSEVYNVSTTK